MKTKIDKNKPLPEHTKLDYDECRAKLILEELFPNRYCYLDLADKPDLQGENVGIEVTIANDPKWQELLSNWVKANHCKNQKDYERRVGKMRESGVEYTGGTQVWPAFRPTFEFIRKAIEKKIEKLEKGEYKHFGSYELFIFTDTYFFDYITEEAKNYLFNKSVSDYYKTVYILSEETELHIFDTEIGKYEIINIDCSEQTKRNFHARRIVEETEYQQLKKHLS